MLPSYFFSLSSSEALRKNQELEFDRNSERFQFLKVRNALETGHTYIHIHIYFSRYRTEQKIQTHNQIGAKE